jgi:phosphatidylserine/phosphatidylglycerophosphate/cardiolipin synthase-like enzyme/uncharacterized membrane protein YdjX (TVP38/TMEM64 family)
VILKEGWNCWRTVRANRASFLIDGAAYFAAFRQAALRAKHSLYIIGWDVDSRVRLVPSATEGDDAPIDLLPLLTHILSARPRLNVYVLGWDFYMIYTFEREPLTSRRFARSHPRLHFELDGVHPVGASHHQKIVVVDDEIAFTGGLDLTIRRWDTPEHLARHPHRVDPAGEPYAPMHDVHMAVDGEAARALGDLARERWRAATGRRLRPPRLSPVEEHPWPTDLHPDIVDVPLGISRTWPAGKATADVREVRNLTLDAIAAAERSIYIEAQYLTSTAVGKALATRLVEKGGPEVAVVLPLEECGWLEKSSMGIMRTRLLSELRAADRYSRLGLYYPTVPGLTTGCVNVHSKVLVVDDKLLRVGSSNLSNRSMGLDTECDLVLDGAGDPRLHQSIALLRNRLLAEHLGTNPDTVSAALESHNGSLLQTIDSLGRGERSLRRLPEASEIDGTAAASPFNLAIFDGLVCDPEQPAPDRLVEDFVPTELRIPVHRSLLRYAVVVMVVLALGAIWRLTPLREYLDIEKMAAMGRVLRGNPAAPLLVLLGYLVGALILFPITLLLTATALIFDPVRGLIYSLVGALSGAALTFWIGRLLARTGVRWLAGPRVARIRRQLQRRGLIAIVAARLLPVGNFSLINMVAGALRVRFRDYMLGNILGLLPGILGLTLFADRLGTTLRNPKPRNLVALALVVVAIMALLGWLRRRLERSTRRAAAAGPKAGG